MAAPTVKTAKDEKRHADWVDGAGTFLQGGRMARVLLIDDDAEVRDMVRKALRSAGHEVIVSEDGREGAKCFRKTPADVVITDMVMPNEDGIETIKALKREFPDVRIIAMSGGSARGGMLSAARHLGAVAVIEKPFTKTELLDAVEKALVRAD